MVSLLLVCALYAATAMPAARDVCNRCKCNPLARSATAACDLAAFLRVGDGMQAKMRAQVDRRKRVSNRVGRPCSTRKRVLRVVCAGSTSAPPARGNENRGPQSEAWHTSVWLRFGAATLARRRALREQHALIVIWHAQRARLASRGPNQLRSKLYA